MNDGRSELASRTASGAVFRASHNASRWSIERMSAFSKEDNSPQRTQRSQRRVEENEMSPKENIHRTLFSCLLCVLCALCGEFLFQVILVHIPSRSSFSTGVG